MCYRFLFLMGQTFQNKKFSLIIFSWHIYYLVLLLIFLTHLLKNIFIYFDFFYLAKHILNKSVFCNGLIAYGWYLVKKTCCESNCLWCTCPHALSWIHHWLLLPIYNIIFYYMYAVCIMKKQHALTTSAGPRVGRRRTMWSLRNLTAFTIRKK